MQRTLGTCWRSPARRAAMRRARRNRWTLLRWRARCTSCICPACRSAACRCGWIVDEAPVAGQRQLLRNWRNEIARKRLKYVPAGGEVVLSVHGDPRGRLGPSPTMDRGLPQPTANARSNLRATAGTIIPAAGQWARAQPGAGDSPLHRGDVTAGHHPAARGVYLSRCALRKSRAAHGERASESMHHRPGRSGSPG